MAVIIKLGDVVIGATTMTIEEVRRAESMGFTVERNE